MGLSKGIFVTSMDDLLWYFCASHQGFSVNMSFLLLRISREEEGGGGTETREDNEGKYYQNALYTCIKLLSSMRMYVPVWLPVCSGHTRASVSHSVTPCFIPLRQGLLLKLELGWGQHILAILLSLSQSVDVTDMGRTMPSFLHSGWNPKSGSHACTD